MASLDLLVVHDVIADGIAGPPRVCQVGEYVILPREHGDGDVADVFERDQVSCPVLMPLEE